MYVWTHVAKCLHMIKQLSIKIWAKNAKKLEKFPKEIGKKFPVGRGDVPPPPPRPPLQFAIENEYLGLTNGKISNYPTTHTLDRIPTIWLEIILPGKNSKPLMSILFTMVRFPPTACIETYSIRAALEREWSYNLEMSLTDQELCQLSYMLYQRKLVHRMILKTRFFHWGRVNSNHRKTHFLSFSTLIPRIHCLIRHIICIFYVWTHSNLNFGPISFFHQSCILKLKIIV